MNTNCHKVYRQVMELEEALLLFEELQKEDQAPNNNEMKQLLVIKIFIRWGGGRHPAALGSNLGKYDNEIEPKKIYFNQV